MSVDLQPTLEGALVTLRPLREDDFAALFAVASDPLIWEQHPASDRYREDVFREFFRGAMASGGAFAVLERETGDIIGSSRFHGYDAAKQEIEVGWTFLARRYWGGRYNGEMKRLMLAHAFRFARRVLFVIGANNIRSQKAIGRIGAVRCGERLEADGRMSVVYRIEAPLD
jgi:RimJ/RimL family protein N-acetyltransferase